MVAAGREHADLQSQFSRVPQETLSARQYLAHLIETADAKELQVWRSIIPVRPTTTRPSPNPTVTPAPTPTDPTLPTP
jgi:hypothetical protein